MSEIQKDKNKKRIRIGDVVVLHPERRCEEGKCSECEKFVRVLEGQIGIITDFGCVQVQVGNAITTRLGGYVFDTITMLDNQVEIIDHINPKELGIAI